MVKGKNEVAIGGKITDNIISYCTAIGILSDADANVVFK